LPTRAKRKGSRGPRLFQPRDDKRGGRLLEVVAYWGDTVLNVDHFDPERRGESTVTIGDPAKAHFLSGGAGREFLRSQVLADVESERCVLRLAGDMRAHVRKDGKVRKVDGQKLLSLGLRDYAHVEYGPVRYFLHYANPPKVELPAVRPQNRLLKGLGATAGLLYAVLVGVALFITPTPLPVDDIPGIYGTPWEETHVKPPEDRRVTMEEVTIQPPVRKPPPTKQPVRAVAPTTAEKPPQRPVATKQPVVAQTQPIATAALKNPPQSQQPQQPIGSQAMPSLYPGGPAGANRPALTNANSGGPGQTVKSAAGGALKGTQAHDNPGQEGGTRQAPTFTDLKNLGAGLGQVLNKKGGISVNFNSSAGGAGMKAGSATRDLNMGGPGKGGSLNIAGTSDRIGGWDKGPGGTGRGGNGPGFDIAGLALGRGHHAGVEVVPMPPQDPLVYSSGNPDLILMFIKQHLNEIRHCYEQTLQRAPNTAGRLKVGFTIGTDGRVSAARIIDGSIQDNVMRACVVGKISRWAFPKPYPTSPVNITYPFGFNPI
jgi:hypothetical protein